MYDVRSHFASSLSILGEWLNQKEYPDYVKEKAREMFNSHQAMLAKFNSHIRGCLCRSWRRQSARTEYTPELPIENRSRERIQEDEEISALWARVLDRAYSERTAPLHATSLCAGLSGRRSRSGILGALCTLWSCFRCRRPAHHWPTSESMPLRGNSFRAVSDIMQCGRRSGASFDGGTLDPRHPAHLILI